jgi:hypothetical protein
MNDDKLISESELKDYFPGKNCGCNASCHSECCCSDVDWTSIEVYDLRLKVFRLKVKTIKAENYLSKFLRLVKELKTLDEMNFGDESLLETSHPVSKINDLINEIEKSH